MSAPATHLTHVPFPVLIGDIGGTNARFALVPDATSAMVRFPDILTADLPTIEEAMEHSLRGSKSRPKSSILALAGPIHGERVTFTNCPWVVEPREIVKRFGLGDVILLNDFEAQSLSLPGLAASHLDRIGGGTATPEGAKLVVGPGTGLGAGALIHARGTWIPVPGEGGHVDLGPVTPRDMALWPHLERFHGRISAEALLSGGGLVRLYRGVASLNGDNPSLATPADIANAGLAQTDRSAAEALSLFATYLGRFAGDLALVFMAKGGVYLAGGIPAKIAPALKSGAFRAAFVDKAPHGALMEEMATAIIVKTDAALAGIAAFARAPTRFGIELAGRWWRG